MDHIIRSCLAHLSVVCAAKMAESLRLGTSQMRIVELRQIIVLNAICDFPSQLLAFTYPS